MNREQPAPAPVESRGVRRSTLTILFWFLMIVVAVFLWKTQRTEESAALSLSYSEFLEHVEDQNVEEVTFHLAVNTAEASGELRRPATAFQTTVPREIVEGLSERLRASGAVVEIREGGRNKDSRSLLLQLAPFILIVGLWAVMLWQLRARWKAAKPTRGNKS